MPGAAAFSPDDTIAALATPAGGLRGVVRLSGQRTTSVLAGLLRPARPDWLGERRARAEAVGVEAGPFGVAPCTVYLWPTQRSYTRQPSAELHLLGSQPLLEAVLQEACRRGARLAEPGEFTLRAFLAGRIDLLQAEGVLAVVDARTTRQWREGLRQVAGDLSRPLSALRDEMLDLLAQLEAGLDFVEEDIEFISAQTLAQALADVIGKLEELQSQLRRRGGSRQPRIVFWGPANAGKSTLLNRLCGSEAALVSEQAGTTRDYVERTLLIDGLACSVVDTAGLQDDTPDPLASAAQRAAESQLEQADVRVLCLDGSRPMSDVEQALLERWRRPAGDAKALTVVTKCDLPESNSPREDALRTSGVNGDGLEALRTALGRAVARAAWSEAAVQSAARCRDALTRATTCMRRAADEALAGAEELAAAELRAALDAVGAVVGAVYTDDLLDRIFSRFCIGK